MKKKLLYSVLLAGVFILALASCSDAVADDGYNLRDWKGTMSGTSGSAQIPFRSFEGCDLQIWEGTFAASEEEGCAIYTVGNVGWWGGCLPNDGDSSSDTASAFYDMSNVAKVTFEAKGSTEGSFWFAMMPAKNGTKKKIDLTVEWAIKEYVVESKEATSKNFALFSFGGGDVDTTKTPGFQVFIKDIAFFDAEGNEVIPEIVN